jgi:hypothetical protein
VKGSPVNGPFFAEHEKVGLDPGAQRTHGEYAHRLQWFAVTFGLWNTGKIASDVFESIGKYTAKFDRGEKEVPRYLYLWNGFAL